jgi:hypothetical protein
MAQSVDTPMPEMQGTVETAMYPVPERQKYLLETPGFVRQGSHWSEFFAIIIGLIFIAIIVLFVLAFFYPDDTDNEVFDIVIVKDIDLTTDTTGSSSDGAVNINNGTELHDQSNCLLKSSRNWSTFCACRVPFYGPQCDLESYSSRYTNIGTPDPKTVISDLSDSIPVDRLSFALDDGGSSILDSDDQDLCTQLCDDDDSCQGVWWTPASGNNFGIGIDAIFNPDIDQTNEKPLCQLLKSPAVIVPGTDLPYSPTVQGTLYLKTTTDPYFKDRIFVYKGTKPPRYWLNTIYNDAAGNQGRTMFNKQLIKFNWTPTNIVNNTGLLQTDTTDLPFSGAPWYGFFSNHSFDPSDEVLMNKLITQSNTNPNPIDMNGMQFVVVSPNDETVRIPASWRELWGAFQPIDLPTDPNGMIETSNADLITYQTGLNTSGSVNTNTMYSLFDTTDGCPNTDPITHDISWNTGEFMVDTVSTITIENGDRLRIISTDNCYHDLVSTDSRWFIINTPFNIGTSRPFRATLDFTRSGTYYIKDRNNPFRIRMRVIVK